MGIKKEIAILFCKVVNSFTSEILTITTALKDAEKFQSVVDKKSTLESDDDGWMNRYM